MKQAIRLMCASLLLVASARAAIYYTAPGGSDSNAGGLADPFFTLTKALTVAGAGDYIFMRGGTYVYMATQTLSKSGTASDTIHIFAYPGEQPLLSWQTWVPASESVRGAARGIYLTGNYYHLKGLELSYAPDNGMKLEGSHNRIEFCSFHHNGDTGLQVGLKSNAANDGTLVCYNLIINCDAYRNVDPATNYENADGFACKLYPGVGNKFVGCRSWQNCDDGWDLYEAEYLIELDSCWTWDNGNPALWGFTSFNGDGNGFKLGGNGVAGGHLAKHCVAFNNQQAYSRGFHQNNNSSGITIYNCTAWGNTVNFGLNDNIVTATPHVLKNNIGCNFFANPQQSGASNAKLIAGSIDTCNSWDAVFGGQISVGDFISTSESDAAAPREADGSLPNNGFARLKPTSAAIDKGVDVGLPYVGVKPDLGAYECTPSTRAGISEILKPYEFALSQNYPNPFNPATTIEFTLAEESRVTLKVFDLLGREVALLVDSDLRAAVVHRVSFNGAHLSSGVYFYRLEAGNQALTRKFMLMK